LITSTRPDAPSCGAIALLCAALGAAAAGAAEIATIPAVAGDIDVDGRLEEPLWREAWRTELPFEVTPGENTPAPVRTEVLVMHGDRHLYVGFRAWDPEPSAIRAHLSDRDDAWSDDWVGVVLDTFNDERRDFLLVVNPHGVQMDDIETWDGSGGGEWDGIWDSAARIEDWGWTAELRIPFSSLRFQRTDTDQVWGFDAIRGYPRAFFRQMGAFPRDRSDTCYLCQAIKIAGFGGVRPGRNLELLPTLTSSRTERRDDFPRGGFGDRQDELDAGVTARWGFTPNLTLAATLNPDFSQVEADARQLDVNEPFALFFAEKRPFFMEGADFFATQMPAVYTRTIRDPSWGTKVTGKEGAHTVGAYVVEDEITNLIFPASDGSAATTRDAPSTASVLRYKRDFGNRLTVGLMATDRRGDDYLNRLAGLDLDLRLGAQDRVMLQVLGSRTRYPDGIASAFDQPAGTFDGAAAELYYYRASRSLSWWLLAQEYDDRFRADLGFIPQVDQRGGQVGIGYDWIGTRDTWYSHLNLKAKAERREDHAGNVLFEEEVVQFTVRGPLQSQVVTRLAAAREGYAGRAFDADSFRWVASLQPSGHSSVSLDVTVGDRIDFANARQGHRVNVAPGFWYRFGWHLRVEGRHIFERLEVDAGRLYDANISEAIVSWQFDARSFVRAIVQRVDYDFVTDLYADGRGARHRQLFTQFLYSYKLNPQTVMFLGYSDNAFGTQEQDLTRADWTVFAKVGYAWGL
jgi:hypothetical protein